MASSEDLEAFQQQLRSWGLQTIVFAMSVKFQGQLLNEPDQQHAAYAEAQGVCNELWESSKSGCAEPFSPYEHGIAFIEHVFSWCSEHRFGC